MKTKRELLTELFATCVSLTDDKFTVFCSYSGHVDSVSVRIFADGWDENKGFDHDFFIGTTVSFNHQDCQAIIDEIKRIKIESIEEREALASDKELQKAKRKKELLKELEELEK